MSKLIWLTGLSGSGKTTIGQALYDELKKDMSNIIFLDGDSFREVLGNDLGYTPKDRLKNAKRIHRMCKFLTSQNINVICSTVALYAEIHKANRDNIDNYIEVFIDCTLDELIRRDQKGLYSKAMKGEITDVVGIDLDYDKPIHCELVINNSEKNKLDEKIESILKVIKD
jgi:adenylyl-sulfate kinase